jgi:hypothetical protein
MFIEILLSTGDISAADFFSRQIMLIFLSSVFTAYLFSAITRLIGVRNFFKISRNLLSVGSFVNYHEGTTFSNAVIAFHVAVFITKAIIFYSVCISRNCPLGFLYNVTSSLLCETVTVFAAFQFLYVVFTLRRLFMLFNARLNEVVMYTVKSDNVFPLNVRKVSDFLPKRNSIVSALRDTLHHHMMLCEILELINSSYALQVLAFIGSKFLYATVNFYLLFLSICDCSFFPTPPISTVLLVLCYILIQLVSLVCCCNSASFQVGII